MLPTFDLSVEIFFVNDIVFVDVIGFAEWEERKEVKDHSD